MKKLSILLASIAVFGAVELSAQTVNEVNTKYNEAVALIQNKNYAGAIPVLEQAVEMGLNAGADAASTVTAAQKLLPTCYFQNGLGLCKTGNFDDALASLDKAVMYSQLFQDFKTEANARKLISQTYTFMGAKAFNEKDWAKAIEVFSKGYEQNPKDTDLALYLAESYAASGDYENGLKVYRDVMALEQQHSRYAEPAAQAKDKYVYYQLLRASEAAAESDKEFRRLFGRLEYGYITEYALAYGAEFLFDVYACIHFAHLGAVFPDYLVVKQQIILHVIRQRLLIHQALAKSRHLFVHPARKYKQPLRFEQLR